MKTKTLRWLAGLVVGVCGAAGSFISCSQPAVECQTALLAPFAATFTVQGSAACMPEPDKGDLIGTEFYHPPSSDGKTYDDSITTFAIHSQTMGKLQRVYTYSTYADGEGIPFTEPDGGTAGTSPNGLGKFDATLPDSNNLCHVTMNQQEEEDFKYEPGGAVDDAGAPANPELKFADEWSNVQFLVTAAAPGTQFSADLTRTENGCAVKYHVVGMWPAVGCTGADAQGNPIADISLCSPCADPDAGMATGSGINPNFPVACTKIFNDDDPFGRGAAPYYCTLMGEPPQVGAQEPACALASQ